MTTARTCIDCGRTFHRRHGHICNTCTSARYRRRHGRKQYAARKVCGWCGVEYHTTDGRIRACSVTHGLWLHHYGEPSRSTDVAIIPREPKRWASRFEVEVPAKPWWRTIVQGPCAWCGDAFTALSTTGDHRYCSDRCSSRASRATSRRLRGRFAVSARRRLRLYERDGWTCQICNKETSREWSHDDPWSPTLDHVEPQSFALFPDHSDDALRTAHALCNSLRGAAALTDAEVRAAADERRSADVVSL